MRLWPCGVFFLTAAVAGEHGDFWRRSWIANPDRSKFEKQVLQSLTTSLDRLIHRGQRWPWDLRRRHPEGAAWRRPGDALRLVLQVWQRRDDPTYVLG